MQLRNKAMTLHSLNQAKCSYFGASTLSADAIVEVGRLRSAKYRNNKISEMSSSSSRCCSSKMSPGAYTHSFPVESTHCFHNWTQLVSYGKTPEPTKKRTIGQICGCFNMSKRRLYNAMYMCRISWNRRRLSPLRHTPRTGRS
jgi:hypothetical protein